MIHARAKIGLGAPVDSGTMVFGAPTEEINVNGVRKVRAVFQVSDLPGGENVVLRLEGKVDDIYFRSDTQDLTVTQDGGYQIYFEPENAVETVRLLWVSKSGGTPVVKYAVMAG